MSGAEDCEVLYLKTPERLHAPGGVAQRESALGGGPWNQHFLHCEIHFHRETGQAERWTCPAKLCCSNFLSGEGNLSLASQGVPENHVGCGLDCGEDQRSRSPNSTTGK